MYSVESWEKELETWDEAWGDPLDDLQVEFMTRGLCLYASKCMRRNPQQREQIRDGFQSRFCQVKARMGEAWMSERMECFSDHCDMPR